MQQPKEQFLLTRIRLFKDHRALEAFVAQFGAPIQKFLFSKLPSKEDADDAFSETWMRFWSYAQSTHIDSAPAVLYAIARNIIAEFYRQREKKPSTATDQEVMENLVEDPLSHQLINRIDAQLLKHELEDMDEDEAFIMTLRFIEGYKIKEIAKFLGRSENATSVLLNRIAHKLRRRLKEKFPNV